MAGLVGRGALHPVTLRFVDDDLERAYQYDEGAKGLSGYRIITGATLVLWAVAGIILPIGTDVDPGLARTVCGLMALAGALCLFLSRWAPTMDRQHALATALTSANGLVILLLSDAAGIIEGYAVGAILLVFVFGFVSRTRFVHATVRTVVIGLGVAAAVLLYDGEGSLAVDLFVKMDAGQNGYVFSAAFAGIVQRLDKPVARPGPALCCGMVDGVGTKIRVHLQKDVGCLQTQVVQLAF